MAQEDPKVKLRIPGINGCKGDLIGMCLAVDPTIDQTSYVSHVGFISKDPKEKIKYSFIVHPFLDDTAQLIVYTRKFFFFKQLKLVMHIHRGNGNFEIDESKVKAGEFINIEVTLGNYNRRPIQMGI